MSLKPEYQYTTVSGQKINMHRYEEDIGFCAYAILKILGKTGLSFEEQEEILKEHHIILGNQANVHSVISDGLWHAESGECFALNTGGSNVSYPNYKINLDDPINQIDG